MGWDIVSLHDEHGTVVAGGKVRDLDATNIVEIIRGAPVRFVIAYSRTQFRWFDIVDCYRCWKDEVKPHLCMGERFHLEDYPDEYCYTASEWQLATGERVIVLEIFH